MISLDKIRKSVVKEGAGETNEVISNEALHPLEIGFKVESKYDIAKRNLRKKYRNWLEELKAGGFYTDFWMWNFVFINFFASFLLFFTISNYIGKLPEMIGINYDDNWSYDLLLSKNYLFVLPSIHVIIAIVALLIAMRSQKRLSHVFAVAFIQFGILVFFELIGLKNLIFYFL